MRLNTPPNYLILPRKLSRGPLRGLKVSQPPPNNTRGGGVADPGTSHELESKCPARALRASAARLGRALPPSSHSRRSSRSTSASSPPRAQALDARPPESGPDDTSSAGPLSCTRCVASSQWFSCARAGASSHRCSSCACACIIAVRLQRDAVEASNPGVRHDRRARHWQIRSRQTRMEPQTLTRHRSLYRTLRLRLARAHRATRAAHSGSSGRCIIQVSLRALLSSTCLNL